MQERKDSLDDISSESDDEAEIKRMKAKGKKRETQNKIESIPEKVEKERNDVEAIKAQKQAEIEAEVQAMKAKKQEQQKQVAAPAAVPVKEAQVKK